MGYVIIAAVTASVISLTIGILIARWLILASLDRPPDPDTCGCGHHRSYHKVWKTQLPLDRKHMLNVSGACSYSFNYLSGRPYCSCQQFVGPSDSIDRILQMGEIGQLRESE